MESTVLEYEKTGTIRKPTGTATAAHRAVERLPVQDGKWVVIAANHDTLWRRLAKLMGKRRARRGRALLLAPRARARTRTCSTRSSASGPAATRPTSSTGSSTRPGVVCAPVYTAADIYEDPYFRERDLLVEYEDEVHGTDQRAGDRARS